MQSFLQKLEQMAGQWLERVEHEAQPIAVQIMTGAVFTHATNPEDEAEMMPPLYSTLEYKEKPSAE